MQLFLDSYGAFLGVQDGKFWVKPMQNEGRSFVVRMVRAIFLTKGVRVTTDALLLALANEIPVLLIDEIGHPLGQVWSGQFGSIATIRKNQALFATQLDCMDFMRKVLLEKLENQTNLLKEWQERFPQQYDFQKNVLNTLGIIEKMKDCFRNWQAKGKKGEHIGSPEQEEVAGTFRGWEGTATRHYFQAMSLALPPLFRFKSRSKRPAYDNFNALLNYLYGILYAFVELGLMKAGLDPYTGFLHADQYNRPTLVYDMIELVRYWAEAVAMSLCVREKISDKDFTQLSEREGIWLTGDGKNVALGSLMVFVEETIFYKGISRKRSTHLDLECVRLATILKEWVF